MADLLVLFISAGASRVKTVHIATLFLVISTHVATKKCYWNNESHHKTHTAPRAVEQANEWGGGNFGNENYTVDLKARMLF